MRRQHHCRNVCGEFLLRPWPSFPVAAIVLLAGSFLYVWLRIEPRLEYHRCGPVFFWERAFLEPFLGRPGGPADAAGAWLAQLNCLDCLGALAFVLCQGAVLLAGLFCLARMGRGAPGVAALVPGFALLLLRNRYGCPSAVIGLGLFLALTSSAAHLWWPWRWPWRAVVVGALVSALLGYLAGLWAALVFGVLTGGFWWLRMGHWRAGLSCVVLAWVAPLAALATGNVSFARLVQPWSGGADGAVVAVLYVSVPVTALLLAWLPGSSIVALADPQPGPPGAAHPPAPGSGGLEPGWRRPGVAVLALLLAGAIVWLRFDRREKLLAEIDYHAAGGQYEAVLASARQVRVLDHPAKARLLLALYHTGRLAEELFSFHDMLEEAPFQATGEDSRAQTQPLLELGLINDAEHTAHEALELEGPRPDLLRLLAHINVLKNRPEAAQVFLNVLGRAPFQGQRADPAWPSSEPPRLPAADFSFLAGVRSRALTNDVLHDGLPVARLLAVTLAAHPTHRMAFEYLMAYRLLDLELKEAIQQLRSLENFDYPRIPRSYEEALLLFQQLAGVRVELNGRTIRPETREKFRQFSEALERSQGTAAEPGGLATGFGDTYWYYYLAARSRQRAAQRPAQGP